MKYMLLTVLSITFAFRCATPKSSEPIIGTEDVVVIENPVLDEDTPPAPPAIPIGAISANFVSNEIPFYAEIESVDTRNGETTISFEKSKAPNIVLPEQTYGAKLSSLRFVEFDRDILLVNAKLKDPNFNKYYVYILKNKQWKQVVNAFAIHKDNKPDTLQPLKVNPLNDREITRYYSVFDIDSESETGYTWKLLEETIPILTK